MFKTFLWSKALLWAAGAVAALIGFFIIRGATGIEHGLRTGWYVDPSDSRWYQILMVVTFLGCVGSCIKAIVDARAALATKSETLAVRRPSPAVISGLAFAQDSPGLAAQPAAFCGTCGKRLTGGRYCASCGSPPPHGDPQMDIEHRSADESRREDW